MSELARRYAVMGEQVGSVSSQLVELRSRVAAMEQEDTVSSVLHEIKPAALVAQQYRA